MARWNDLVTPEPPRGTSNSPTVTSTGNKIHLPTRRILKAADIWWKVNTYRERTFDDGLPTVHGATATLHLHVPYVASKRAFDAVKVEFIVIRQSFMMMFGVLLDDDLHLDPLEFQCWIVKYKPMQVIGADKELKVTNGGWS